MFGASHVHVSIRISSGYNSEITAEVKSAVINPDDIEGEVELAVKKAQNDMDRILRNRRKIEAEEAAKLAEPEPTV